MSEQLVESTNIASQFDRLPPSSVEAEMCVLAAMMLDKEQIGAIHGIIHEKEAFFQVDHQIIYERLLDLYQAGRSIDPIILRAELDKRKLLEEVGGTAYLAQIVNTIPSAAHGAHYAGIVREKYMLRQLIWASNETLKDAYAPHDDAKVIVDRAEKRVFDIAQKDVQGTTQPLETVLHEVWEMITGQGQKGVMTGFHEMDEMLNGMQRGELIIVAARPSMGKAQPLDSQVLTLDGWKRMGDLQVGDNLASVDGRRSRVIGVFPQGRRQVYRITFADGRSTECCAEHLWKVHFRGWDAPRVLQTSELIEKLGRKRYRNRLFIEQFAGEFGSDDDLPLDPWLLGALIGDGCLAGSAVMFSSADGEVLERVEQCAGAGMSLVHQQAYDYRLRQAQGAHRRGVQGVVANPVKNALQGLGLWDSDASTKFIPECYKRATRESRARLLAGLLDTDGWVEKWGSLRFCTCSEQLARDVVDLMRSLGGSGSYAPKSPTYTYRGRKLAGQKSFVCNLQHPEPASLDLISAKQSRLRARRRLRRLNIASIEPTRRAQTQCIAVSHPSHLYITDDFTVTHNTSFAMNIVEQIAADQQVACGVFSLEMSKQQLAQRLLCARGNIDSHKLRKGMLSNEDHQKLAMVVGELAKAPIFVDDSAALTVLDLRAKARRLKREHNIQCIMIDYLQLMDNPGPESRQQQISEISRGIKAIARDLMVPVICLSQLNRASEGRDGHKPRMSDLRESGAIEQDADVVMLLHREDYYHKGEENYPITNIGEVIIEKQRNGPTGTVQLVWDGKCTRFRNKANVPTDAF